MSLRKPATLWTFLVLILFLVGPVASDVITSPSDNRDYLPHQLKNGLRVLLISDPDTDKSAAALDVRVGSGSDPAERPGLAHLLEHMLFLGTEQYPEAGEYQAFIQQHGGSDNAYTMPDHTNYYFDIQPQYLRGALERFSQFFVAPLLNPSFVERERSVVHAEFSTKLQSDGRRYLAARRQAFDPEHPESGFAVGNENTLADREGDLVREDLAGFYETHYRAESMNLVVLGRESTDLLRDWVEKLFEGVPAGKTIAPEAEVPIYPHGALPLLQKITPVKEIRQAVFSFAIPSALDEYAAKPLSYIASLLGDEGPGSLLALLKEHGWADGLSAGGGLTYETYGTFEVTISLTESGLDNYQLIGTWLFALIQQIRDEGVASWVFDEQRKLAEIDFRFREDVEAYTLVRAFAARMHDYPVEDLYYAPYRYDNFNRELILSYLDRLQPRNLHLLLIGPELETDQVEDHYGVHYSLEALPDDVFESWSDLSPNPDLYLPKPNPFIAEDLELRHEEPGVSKPTPIEIQDGFTLWFDHDTSYGSPRGNFYVSIRSPFARTTPKEAVLTDLYAAVVVDQLNAFSYPAQLAGLGFELYDHQRGFTLKISGYTDKQAVLLETIIAALQVPEVTSERFDRLRDNLVRRLRNVALERPYGQVIAELRRLLLDSIWWPDAKIEAAESATPEALEAFVSQLLGSVESVALAHGNYTRKEVLSLSALVAGELLGNSRAVAVPHGQVIRLAAGETRVRTLPIDHPDAVLALYLQGASRKLSDRARFYLAGQVLNAPFYQSLRTKQQMGYFVLCGAMDIMQLPGLVFVVQSPNQTPDIIEAAITEFLQGYKASLDMMTDTEFEQHRSSLVSDVMRQEEKLRDRSGRYWVEIDRKDYEFDSRERLSEKINEVSLDDFRQFFQTSVLNPSRPRLVVRSFGEAKGTGSALPRNEIVDPLAFRSTQSLFLPVDE
jgi:secreted Zn-dependent insulinase-like peptidase